MLGPLALFAGPVTFDNLIDYQTNYAFCPACTEHGYDAARKRADVPELSSPSLWELAYALIIAGEGARHLALPARRLCCCATCVCRPQASTAPRDWRSWPIAAAEANPLYPFGAVIIGAADCAVLAQGVNSGKTNPILHGEIGDGRGMCVRPTRHSPFAASAPIRGVVYRLQSANSGRPRHQYRTGGVAFPTFAASLMGWSGRPEIDQPRRTAGHI